MTRVAGVVLGVALVAGLIALVASRDQSAVKATAPAAPGQAYRDQGNAHLAPGARHPAYNSNPPTSGPHAPVALPADRTSLNTDQLLRALELGDVVVLYGRPRDLPALTSLARTVAGSWTPALASAGQAVVLDPQPGTGGVVAAAWGHLLRVASPSDPQLEQFASFWLGHGATR